MGSGKVLVDLGGGLIVDRDRQLQAIEQADCEESLYTFLKTAWRYIDPAPWTDSWAIEAIAEHLQAVVDGQIRKLIINQPPRTAKTSLASIALPAWTWAQRLKTSTSGPGVQFLHASYAQALALDASIKCKRLVESPWYQRHWGSRFQLLESAVSKFTTSEGGTRFITSVDSGVTGRGGDVICADDPNDAGEVSSEAALKSAIEWWDGKLSTRLNNPRTGCFIVVQQRIAEDDITGHILETEEDGWTHLVLPMRFEASRRFTTPIGWTDPRQEEGELLWPARFGEQEVHSLERRLGPWRAAGQLQQRPEPQGGGIIKRDWWQTWDDKAFPPMDFIMASLDTAYTEKEENDPSALTVWGVFSHDPTAKITRMLDADGRPIQVGRSYDEPAPKVMLMSAWSERLEFHDLVRKVAESCRKLKVDMLLIENKAAGISVAQEIRRLHGHEGWSVVLDDPKSQDKVARLYSVQHIWADGTVYAPDRSWSDMVISQVAQFPKGRHDDIVDTCSAAVRRLRVMGLLARPDEVLAEKEAAIRFEGRQLAPLYPG
jgi:predicted phage terminase large subunit-like protein